MSEEDKSGQTIEPDERLKDLDEDVRKLVQSETDRVRTKYSRELKEATAQLEVYKAKAEKGEASILGNLQNELATVRAQGELNKKVAAMLDRAVNEGLEPQLAVRFAETANPDESFDIAKSVLEKAITQGIQARLVNDSGPPPISGDDKNLTALT